jgi:hypothetical protein
MNPDFEKDLYLLFNMAFDGLDKHDLSKTESEGDLADVANYIRETEQKPQVAIINTRSKDYPKALLFRKIVDGKAVVLAFWKRGIICEGMAASITGVSQLNEFMWVQDAKTGKFNATLKPKLDAVTNKSRQTKMKHAAVSSALVEPLNKKEYQHLFGGDILKKLETERGVVLNGMKERGLVPQDAIDPIHQKKDEEISAHSMLKTQTEPHTVEKFVAIQRDGVIKSTVQTVAEGEDLQSQLMKEFMREARQAEKDDEKEKGLEPSERQGKRK